jgi:hypothetical protein
MVSCACVKMLMLVAVLLLLFLCFFFGREGHAPSFRQEQLNGADSNCSGNKIRKPVNQI